MPTFHQRHNSLGDMIFNTVTYENSSFYAHFHKSYELIYIIDGNFICIIDGKNYTFEKGQFALIFPYQIHSWQINNGKAHICVFSENYVKSFTKAVTGCKGKSPSFYASDAVRSYYIHTMLEAFPNYFNQPAPENALPIKSALYGVLNEFLISAELVKSSEQSSELIVDVLNFISQHFNENISLRTVANALGYSYQHISRVFNQKINAPFKDFLNRYRFEYARQLLIESNESIAEIAHESGFQSIRNFNLVCMKLSGKTPKEIRSLGAEIISV